MASKKVIKVAINGFGRIGRLAFRLMHEDPQFEVVAINDLTDAEQLAYLLKYDTAHGRFHADEITFKDNFIIIGKHKVEVISEKDPKNLPWGKLGIDVVLECTGLFVDKEKASWHLEAGAKKVLISAPAKGDLKTVVFNVNDNILTADDNVVSAASCTTNCLAPVIKVLDDNFKVLRGAMTTVHAYTADQMQVDGAHKKGIYSRRGRACAQNIVPASTGAAKAIGLVLPHLKGKLDGGALRVPTITGSIVDLTVELEKHVTCEEINKAFAKAANETLKYTEDPIVSSDVIGETHGSIFDAHQTQIVEVDGKQMVKVMAWYDNEMSYTAQMIRTLKKLASF